MKMSTYERTEIEKAIDFAFNAHKGQLRKYTNEPYINHPLDVGLMIWFHTHDYAMVQAAILHDTIEDCDVTPEQIEELFGPRVRILVQEVTDVSRPEDGNRKLRKALDREHLSKASPDGKTIKLADLIDNTKSITIHDQDFAKVYMKEKKELLEVLSGGNPRLFEIAKNIVDNYYKDLEND